MATLYQEILSNDLYNTSIMPYIKRMVKTPSFYNIRMLFDCEFPIISNVKRISLIYSNEHPRNYVVDVLEPSSYLSSSSDIGECDDISSPDDSDEDYTFDSDK